MVQVMPLMARDANYGGGATIGGTVKTTGGAPVSAFVTLDAMRGKNIARSAYTDPATGAFSFPGLNGSIAFELTARSADGLYVSAAAVVGSGNNLVVGAGSGTAPNAFMWDGAQWRPIGMARWNGTDWK